MLDEDNGEDEHSDDNEDIESTDSQISPVCPIPLISTIIPISPSCSRNSLPPIQRIQHRASFLSGIPLSKAFEVDDMKLGVRIGEFHMSHLTELFYSKVLNDEDEWFRLMFSTDIETNCQNLSDFLMQRLGGPTYYSDRKGNPNLIRRHGNFEISVRAVEKWLDHMEDSVEELEPGVLNEEHKEAFMNYLRFTAYYLHAAQEEQWAHSGLGTHDNQLPHEHTGVQ